MRSSARPVALRMGRATLRPGWVRSVEPEALKLTDLQTENSLACGGRRSCGWRAKSNGANSRKKSQEGQEGQEGQAPKKSFAAAISTAIWPIQKRNIHLMISALISAPSCLVMS